MPNTHVHVRQCILIAKAFKYNHRLSFWTMKSFQGHSRDRKVNNNTHTYIIIQVYWLYFAYTRTSHVHTTLDALQLYYTMISLEINDVCL